MSTNDTTTTDTTTTDTTAADVPGSRLTGPEAPAAFTTTAAGPVDASAYVAAQRTDSLEHLERLRATAADTTAEAGTRNRAACHALAQEAALIDEVDARLLAGLIDALERVPGIREGDFIRYAGGTLERVSAIWQDTSGAPSSVQTSRGGSFHLGPGYVSFSGGLNHGCAVSTLVDTGERRPGAVWFPHHGRLTAGCARHALAPFRVWDSHERDSSRTT